MIQLSLISLSFIEKNGKFKNNEIHIIDKYRNFEIIFRYLAINNFQTLSILKCNTLEYQIKYNRYQHNSTKNI